MAKLTKTEWNPDLAAPLVKSTFTMKDLLEAGDISYTEDANNFITIVYSSRLNSELAKDMVTIADQTIDTTFSFNFPLNLPIGGSTTESYNFNQEFTASNGEIFDSIYINKGNLHFEAKGDMNHDGKIVVVIQKLTKNGVVFRQEIDYKYLGGQYTIVTEDFDLSGYKMKFSHVGATNLLGESVDITAYADANTNYTTYTFDVEKRLEGLEFHKVFGYFGQYEQKFEQNKVSIELFDGLTIGEQILEDPRINLIFYNSIGAPLNINFLEFKAVNGLNEVVLSSPAIQAINIDYPNIYNVGQTSISKITLDKNNSNVQDVFDISPEKITYEVDAKSNPNGIVVQNFVIDTSKFFMDLEVEIPLYGRAWNFTMQDTNNFNFEEDIGDIDEIQYIELRINALNELPAEGRIQIYFTDTNYVVIDSLFTTEEQIIKSAIPGAAPTYRVIQKTQKTTSIILDKAKMDKIHDAGKILSTIRFSTVNTGGTIVKFYSDYTVDLKVGVNVKLKTEF
ncbi:MAG: hypothetical protein K9J13_02875 [Saprospiraceae bacterium]|nr:hypothetical protein [Saprospiraceae bacterium]